MNSRAGFRVFAGGMRTVTLAVVAVFWASPIVAQEDQRCFVCHGVPGASKTLDTGQTLSLYVDESLYGNSVHGGLGCVSCHADVTDLPHEETLQLVNCAVCHAEQVAQHHQSIHGQLLSQDDRDAPACSDCHTPHATRSKTDPLSPSFPTNVPDLCGRCHREGERAATRHISGQQQVVRNYTMSIHGKGLFKDGLLVTATCSDCHTAHHPLPRIDPESSVNPKNIAGTCGRCHYGVEEVFLTSIHSPSVSKSDKTLPVCSGCHSAHTIRRADVADFKLNVMQTCGRCHEQVTRTYFDTHHGKVARLGSVRVAKCYDCHGAHDVLPPSEEDSHLAPRNIVATCGQCHEKAHVRFAGYLTHATHRDRHRYPALFYTFWGMTALLVGTFVFFGLHALAWLWRSFKEMGRHPLTAPAQGQELMFQRFDPIARQIHFVMVLSFFGLALTGMTLKFSHMAWAVWLSKALGGFPAAGVIHRACAVVMFLVFGLHLAVVVLHRSKAGASWRQMLLAPSSLIPNWNDVREFMQTVKWFFRGGPRPRYGQWTYWEKFDYFAVFWGIAIIGITGFVLWFPEWCTYIVPGWFINVATIIHSDEALLAVGFIFTVHFFNTHFRPEKFPMDTTIFTGRMRVEELKRDRPSYYERLLTSGELERHLVAPASEEFRFWATVFGTLALLGGFSLIVLIIWSMLFG